jgi:hypothetical protein
LWSESGVGSQESKVERWEPLRQGDTEHHQELGDLTSCKVERLTRKREGNRRTIEQGISNIEGREEPRGEGDKEHLESWQVEKLKC